MNISESMSHTTSLPNKQRLVALYHHIILMKLISRYLIAIDLNKYYRKCNWIELKLKPSNWDLINFIMHTIISLENGINW